ARRGRSARCRNRRSWQPGVPSAFSSLCNYRYMRPTVEAKAKHRFCRYSKLCREAHPAARPGASCFLQALAMGYQQTATHGRSPCSGGVVERVDDAVDDLLDQHLVVALAHDADHRLGARRAHDQPAMAVEPSLGVLDGVAHLGVLERLAAAVAHVL